MATCSTTTSRGRCRAICQDGQALENSIVTGGVMHHGDLVGANDPVGSGGAEATRTADPRDHERPGETLGQMEVCGIRGATLGDLTILRGVSIAVGATVGRRRTRGRAIKERARHMVQREQDPSNPRVGIKGPDHSLALRDRDPTGAQMMLTMQRHGSQRGMRDQCQFHIPRPRRSSCTEHRPSRPP